VPRARLTRQELKTQDEITTLLERSTELAYEWRKELIIGGGAVLLIVLIVVGWTTYASRRDAAASAQLATAIAAYNDPAIKSEKDRYDKTIAEAQKTINSYGALPAGSIAKYYVGLSQAGLGDTESAAKTLQEVINRGDANIKPVAQFALGGIYKRHGDLQKAIDTLKPLYDNGGYSKAAVALELGKLHEANKQADQAKNYFNEVATNQSDSPLRTEAEAALKRMGVTPQIPGVSAPKPATPAK
jgi:predicted negative regulator of RcsB-dependent stress response